MTDTQWFREAGFGLFIHWGLYALQGLGEWAMYTSAIPAEEYRALAERFSPGHFDADEWAQLACGAGMRYMVMTTKHHDGFCLFDTRTTGFCSTKTAAGRDFVREYVDACRRHGLKVGLYFSVKDWQYPGYFRGPEKDPEGWAEFMRVYEAQLRELLTNYGKIDVLWFDGGDAPHFGLVDYPREAWQADRLERLVREMQPGILINGRAGMHADFGTPERTGYGVMAASETPQEICDSLTAEAWGYRPGDPCISLREVMERIRGAAVNGCNLLLNASPDSDGRIPDDQQALLRRVGEWMRANGEAFYGTARQLPLWFEGTSFGPIATKERFAYLLMNRRPYEGQVFLWKLAGEPVSACMLSTKAPLTACRAQGRIVISGFRQQDFDEMYPVVRLEFAEPVRAADPFEIFPR